MWVTSAPSMVPAHSPRHSLQASLTPFLSCIVDLSDGVVSLTL